jgi:catalase
MMCSALRPAAVALSAVLALAAARLQAQDSTQTAPAPAAAPADVPAPQGLPQQLVQALDKLAGGPHAGYRANHAKGIMLTGTFTPAAGARSLTKASQFRHGRIPVLVRFSDPTGVPNLPDADPNASPHGIAIRFQLPDGNDTDIVSISINGFPAATPEDFLALLTAVAASPPGTPEPTPIQQFLGTHPKAVAFVTALQAAPVSFATLAFYGVNAFKFTNAHGVEKYGRYRIMPVAGLQSLTAEQSAHEPPNYLMDELPRRLAQGPIQFRLSVQLAEAGDPINDDTQVWPDSRPQVQLGVLSLTRILPDSAAREKKVMFSPLLLTDGIAPSDDPVLLMRPAAYAVSFARRAQQ